MLPGVERAGERSVRAGAGLSLARLAAFAQLWAGAHSPSSAAPMIPASFPSFALTILGRRGASRPKH